MFLHLSFPLGYWDVRMKVARGISSSWALEMVSNNDVPARMKSRGMEMLSLWGCGATWQPMASCSISSRVLGLDYSGK